MTPDEVTAYADWLETQDRTAEALAKGLCIAMNATALDVEVKVVFEPDDRTFQIRVQTLDHSWARGPDRRACTYRLSDRDLAFWARSHERYSEQLYRLARKLRNAMFPERPKPKPFPNGSTYEAMTGLRDRSYEENSWERDYLLQKMKDRVHKQAEAARIKAEEEATINSIFEAWKSAPQDW